MPCLRSTSLRFVLAAGFAFALTLAAAAPGDLHLVSRIDMPAIRGRVDHLAYAPDTNLLYAAALGANAVQVVDLGTSRPAAELRANEPQGVAYSVALHRLFVANGRAGNVEAFEGSKRVAAAGGLPDADNLRMDERSGLVYVAYGRAIAALDIRTLAVTRRYALPGHPEGFEVSGTRIYVNVPAIRAVVVLDQENGRTAATWSIAPAAANFPMAADLSSHRLFVATRRPSRLLVLDTESGRQIAKLPICADADDLFLQDRQLYAICGDGH